MKALYNSQDGIDCWVGILSLDTPLPRLAGLGLDNLLDRYTQLIYLVTQTRYLAWLPLIENSLIKHYRPIKATL